MRLGSTPHCCAQWVCVLLSHSPVSVTGTKVVVGGAVVVRGAWLGAYGGGNGGGGGDGSGDGDDGETATTTTPTISSEIRDAVNRTRTVPCDAVNIK